MKQKHMLHYAAKRLRRNRKIQLFIMVLMAVAYVLLYCSFIFFMGMGHAEKEVEDTLNVPLSSCGMIEYQSDTVNAVDGMERAQRFTREAFALKEVGAFGCYECGNAPLAVEGDRDGDCMARVLEIQSSVEKESKEEDPSAVKTVDMSRELFEMQDISLIEGESPENLSDDGYMPVYLGYELREIPLGTVFIYEPGNVKYRVVGIMGKGTRFADIQALLYNFEDPLPYCIDMDRRLLILVPEGSVYGVQNLFCAADGYTYEEAAAALKELGKKEGMLVKTGTYSARLDTLSSFNQKIRSRLNTGMFVLCLTVAVACTAIQLLQMYIRRKELGIWLANGISRRELPKILLLENIIRSAVSIMISVPAARLFLGFLFSGQNDRRLLLEIKSFMYGVPLIVLVLSALLLAVAVSAVPVIVAAKRQTADLVKGVWG
ncbi:MAG: ABC transporter permease [Ruminococcus flavefaciens]|nr:ABC transporter permease [Ruminococcus flavefaciens]